MIKLKGLEVKRLVTIHYYNICIL